MRVLTFLLLTVFTVGLTYAQDTPSKHAINEKLVLAGDNMHFGYYEKALPSIHWLLQNAPKASSSVYSMAFKALEETAGKVEDTTKKNVLLDSLIIAFRLKEKHFGLTDIEKNKLAFRYFDYFLNNKEKVAEAYPLFHELFESPDEVINNNLVAFMYITNKYHELVKPLSTAEILANYELASRQIASRYFSKNLKLYETYSKYADDQVFKTLNVNEHCQAIKQIATHMTAPDSVYLAKKIVSLTLDSKCGKSEHYLKALNILSRSEPSPGLHKILAQYAAAEGNYALATTHYVKAIELEPVADKRAAIYLSLAEIYFLNNDKTKARASALEAVAADPGQTSVAYSFIGNLYLSSYNDCAERHDRVQDKAVYLVAYDAFEKAGDKKGMEEAAKRFPTREEAFENNLFDGDQIDVDCWIQLSTKLRTRVSN
ncbi:hypothetical protein [Roseivirga sp. UBA838]|uniref:hypothetical protein n=1 Tax=Roseivirga sp. UBA838 TaxID=1947393 RepID=UPI00257E121D|nr:hypothetical protein [Roseivirga sp. UBA838]|tara:strand:+ start:8685 stop:9971 length:1287 start_codon:yes stop_codon:yes gene_type:complete